MNAMRHVYALLMLPLLMMSADVICGQHNVKDWAWLYHKRFTKQELSANILKSVLVFHKEGVPNFTQLLFSWNALRPPRGHFSFSVQARNMQTKRWGPWHKMVEWGKNRQRSYGSKTKASTSYHYVRLETGNSGLADAFRVKVRVHNGADLAQLKGLAVAISNYKKFKSEPIANAFTTLASVHIKQVPKISQFRLDHPDERLICSPTSMSMLASFLVGQRIDPVAFAEKAYDRGLKVYGSWPFNTAHAFDRCAGKMWFFTARLNSFKGLHAWLQRGIPVVVSVRGILEGGAKPYNHGHLLLVVGWDAEKKEVICHDSAFKEHERTLTRYSLKTFLKGWECSHRLAYLAEPVTN